MKVNLNQAIINLPLASCVLLDFPDSGVDCPVSPNGSLLEGGTCLRCPILGRFVTVDEGLDGYGLRGHVTCIVLGGLAIVLGIIGALMNILIISVFRRQKSRRAFDSLLLCLASVDLLISVLCVITAITIIGYYENWDRGIMLWVHVYTKLSILFGRSASAFMTVLIALERYLVLAYPLRTKGLFTPEKTRILAGSVLAFAVLMAFPRFSSVYVGRNVIGRNISSTKHYEYLILPTVFEDFWYRTMKGVFNLVDFWGPLPLLLVLNTLVYYQLRKIINERKSLNMSQSMDINATRMFVPVVIVLFVCNVEPILHYWYIFVNGVNYREHDFGVLVSFAVNSAANFPIYYFRGSSFRKETRQLVSKWFPSSVSNHFFPEQAANRSESGDVQLNVSASSNNSQVE